MGTSRNRLSSIFSSISSQGSESSVPPTDDAARSKPAPARRTPSPNKLIRSLRERERVSSSQLAPPVAYPSPASPRPGLGRRPTIKHIRTDDAGELLSPPSVPDGVASQSASPTRSRASSPATSRHSSRPVTPTPDIIIEGQARPLTPTTPSNQSSTKTKRRSWLPSISRGSSRMEEPHGPMAWVIGHQGKLSYNLALLLNAERVPELWDDDGDTIVYLFPRTSGKGPSFRVDSSIYTASSVLTQIAHGSIYSSAGAPTGERIRQPLDAAVQDLTITALSTPPRTPEQSAVDTESSIASRDMGALSDPLELSPHEIHMYLPLTLSTDGAMPSTGSGEPRHTSQDMELLIAVRNLFAFLLGQSLVATERSPTTFSMFLRISDMLKSYQFSNLDGSTFGEVANASFDSYVDELHLADIRFSREKTVEGIVLGERMRSVMLYNEAFVHGVGKYDDITRLGSPKFQMISSITRNRMERASMDLFLRCKTLNEKLEDFDFPAIFSGIMSSKTADERKIVRFDAWRASFIATRKHILGYYRQKYGSWPPKASSRKNTLETSGLNRLVLKDVYHDFSSWYDLFVDRSSLTTRVGDAPSGDDGADDTDEPLPRALRRVLSEYDRSTPPVQPPVPFDTPLLPSLASIKKDYGVGDARKDAQARGKKLKDDEVESVLRAAHNRDAEISTPFLGAIRELERRSAHGKTIDEIRNLRNGQWIFMYAVLQSLPMLVVDAPGVRWTEGVEYFLCEPPRSGVPWAREDAGVHRSWYGIAGSSGVVSLPSDLIEHGVEGIYRRSHCWEMAEKWTGHSELLSTAAFEDVEQPLPSPPALLQTGSRPASPGTRSNRNSVMMLGLEALPLPGGVTLASPNVRPASYHEPVRTLDPTKTFDAIIGAPPPNAKGKKKK